MSDENIDEQQLRCLKCGKFVKTSAFVDEGGSEIVHSQCVCDYETEEEY